GGVEGSRGCYDPAQPCSRPGNMSPSWAHLADSAAHGPHALPYAGAYRQSAGKECMNTDLAIVLALLLTSMVLFIRNKPRMDVVALLVIVALPLSGVLSIQEAVAGFSDPSVLLIAALFVIGDGLVRTGIAYQLGDWMVRQ